MQLSNALVGGPGSITGKSRGVVHQLVKAFETLENYLLPRWTSIYWQGGARSTFFWCFALQSFFFEDLSLLRLGFDPKIPEGGAEGLDRITLRPTSDQEQNLPVPRKKNQLKKRFPIFRKNGKRGKRHPQDNSRKRTFWKNITDYGW